MTTIQVGVSRSVFTNGVRLGSSVDGNYFSYVIKI